MNDWIHFGLFAGFLLLAFAAVWAKEALLSWHRRRKAVREAEERDVREMLDRAQALREETAREGDAWYHRQFKSLEPDDPNWP